MMKKNRQTAERKPMNPKSLANLKGGSRKGVPNKTTTLAKEAIAQVAEGLGGVQRMIEWAMEKDENERIFWSSIYTKLIPVQTEITGKDGEAIQVEQRVREDADAVASAIASLAERARAARVDGEPHA